MDENSGTFPGGVGQPRPVERSFIYKNSFWEKSDRKKTRCGSHPRQSWKIHAGGSPPGGYIC